MIHLDYDICDIPEDLKPFYMVLRQAEEDFKAKAFKFYDSSVPIPEGYGDANMMRIIAQSAWYAACNRYDELRRLNSMQDKKWKYHPIVKTGIYWERVIHTSILTSGIVYHDVLESAEYKGMKETSEYKAWSKAVDEKFKLRANLKAQVSLVEKLEEDMKETSEYKANQKFTDDYHKMMIIKKQKEKEKDG